MLLRGVRCALAAAVATGSFLLVLPGPVPAATTRGQPSLVLVGQDATVTPPAPGDAASFSIVVGITGTPPNRAEIGLSFYSKLSTASGFEQTLSSPPSGTLLHTVSPQPVSSLKRVGGGVQVVTSIVVGDTPAPPGSPTVNLNNCVAGSEVCSGVYPVVVQLFGDSGSVSRFTTYLTYAEAKSPVPLVFAWVVPVGSPVNIRPAGPLGQAIPSLSTSRVKHLAELAQELAANPGVQVTVAPSPSTLERLEESGTPDARTTLSELHGVAAEGPHRLIAQPYVPINLSELAAAGIPTEIEGQVRRAAAIMLPVVAGLTPTEAPSWQTWVATGELGPAIAGGMREVGARDLVLPDTDLPAASEEDHATWTQTFSLSLGHGQSVMAAVSDSSLSDLFTSEPSDPVLAANQLLADLAFIQSELPGAANPTRGVIAVPPPSWDPDPGFVDTLVAGLTNNPVISTATLNGYFTTVPSGANGASSTRRLNTGFGGSALSSAQAAAIVTARKQITGFVDAVEGQQAAENQLEDVLLSSESNELSPARQRADLAAFERHLGAELGGVQVVKNTVTLTARTASIPIIITSRVGFPLRATLTL
ncbi:MAG TPA: hypothetical protein VEJ44_00130, partial [Acidimicrobiales bacterium]|nr:hypothetical protein [Acidimicrobiales bacterium]